MHALKGAPTLGQSEAPTIIKPPFSYSHRKSEGNPQKKTFKRCTMHYALRKHLHLHVQSTLEAGLTIALGIDRASSDGLRGIMKNRRG